MENLVQLVNFATLMFISHFICVFFNTVGQPGPRGDNGQAGNPGLIYILCKLLNWYIFCLFKAKLVLLVLLDMMVSNSLILNFVTKHHSR